MREVLRVFSLCVVCLSLVFLAACEEDNDNGTEPEVPVMTLTSTAFGSGSMIPEMYTCEDDDISPPLSWTITNAPDGIESFALIVDDPDAPGGTWVHWIIFNIPDTTSSLAEDASPGGQQLPAGCIEGFNDFGNVEYGGPCPPTGQNHRYFFRLYALDTVLDLQEGATRDQVDQAMAGHILVEDLHYGRFER